MSGIPPVLRGAYHLKVIDVALLMTKSTFNGVLGTKAAIRDTEAELNAL